MFSKRKVACADAEAAAAGGDDTSAPKKRRDEGRQFSQFLKTIGSSLESFIDSTPLGVPEPAPWTEANDKDKAKLSNPLFLLQEITGALSPSSISAQGGALMLASARVLLSIREGLEDAVMAEARLGRCDTPARDAPADDAPVIVEPPADAAVPSKAGEPYVDLGVDRWGNSPRKADPAGEVLSECKRVKRSLTHFTQKKVLPFIDNLVLRANGIVVSEDDCSVCSVGCSLDSLVDDAVLDYVECPSIVTELADARDGGDDGSAQAGLEDDAPADESSGIRVIEDLKLDCTQETEELTDGEDEDYVVAGGPDEVVDADFVLA